MEVVVSIMRARLKERIDWFFQNTCNSHLLLDSQIEEWLKYHIGHLAMEMQNELDKNSNILFSVKINDMVVTIRFELWVGESMKSRGYAKKAICRFPSENSYANLFSEMGLCEEAIDVAIMSAKAKLEKMIKYNN